MKKRYFDCNKLTACISFLFCITLFSINVSAADYAKQAKDYTPNIYGVDIENSGEQGTTFDSRAIAECGGGPHEMKAHGWGEIINVDTNETVVSWGCCAQCTKCNLVIVTQGEPGTPLGYYTTWQPHEVLTSYMTVIRQSSNNISYTSDSTIPGIRFSN